MRAMIRDDRRNVAVVRAVGVVNRPGLEACDYVLGNSGSRNAVLDLTEATYVDFRAVGLLQARSRVFKASGGEFVIAAGSREVRDLIRVGAGNDIRVLLTVQEAIAYLEGEGVVTACARRAVAKRKTG